MADFSMALPYGAHCGSSKNYVDCNIHTIGNDNTSHYNDNTSHYNDSMSHQWIDPNFTSYYTWQVPDTAVGADSTDYMLDHTRLTSSDGTDIIIGESEEEDDEEPELTAKQVAVAIIFMLPVLVEMLKRKTLDTVLYSAQRWMCRILSALLVATVWFVFADWNTVLQIFA